ncbi:DUF4407 domain-containing protein [Pedobacter sp. P351]|uniref:DUF4407 domain-containing protein n=1 Tax=Pedobacter superstes TaxID=3133441 RepID=UPI00309E0F60
MKTTNWWLRIGCFLTGYNFEIVSRCSEITAKTVKRYTSAMLIVCLLWGFIGFNFTSRYLGVGFIGSIAGAFIFTLIIIQVERQIILAVHKSTALLIFRGAMACMMALIGSLVIDQIIFKQDIEQEKIKLLGEKVNNLLPARTSMLKGQIAEIQTAINIKETERVALMNDISANPFITAIEKTSGVTPVNNTVQDSLRTTTSTRLIKTTSTTLKSISNPKVDLIQPLNLQINSLSIAKNAKDSLLLTLRASLESEIKSKVGFLDELNVMKRLISDSGIAFAVWLLWILFLLGLELFILVSKIGEKENDYDITIKHQMDLQLKRLQLLAKTSTGENV